MTKKRFAVYGLRFTCLLFPFLVLASPLHGETFSSSSYQIQWGNFNSTSGLKNSTNYRLTDTVGEIAPGQYTGSSLILKSGFQYIHASFGAFSFDIDDLSIDFGTLTPGIGTTLTNTITISAPYGRGYQIMAHENHPLRNQNLHTVPDTTCDGADCSETTSGVWTNNSVYGFGFNAIGINNSGVTTGIGTSSYFTDSTYFRQFADYSASEASQIIMSEDSSSSQSRLARVSYKINISSLQSAGNYENGLVFTAVPIY